MTTWQAQQLEAIIENIGRAISCAADPHVDCRDEMHSLVEAAASLAKELTDSTKA